MSHKNSKLSVHVRVYRGKTMTYNAKGESTNENHVVKLEYNTAEYKRFLSMIRANGFIEAKVEKVLDLTKKVEGKEKNEAGYYEEVKPFEDIQKEFDVALNPEGVEKPQTAEQKQIAELTARLDALTGGKEGAKDIKVNDAKNVDAGSKTEKVELSDDKKAELKVAREKYVELYGKKGHPGWSVEELNVKIAEFKPEPSK